jgi:succinate dehydrogenase/fumarate reductase flavoprotein subunit
MLYDRRSVAAGDVDVIVLGTGAAGLTAALTAAEEGAAVEVFEKADLVGGTTAWSGGHVWIPGNPHMAEVGATDSRDEALTYIMSLSHGMIDERLAEAYVDAAPAMVRYLEERTPPVEFYAVAGIPDYHPEFPGGKPGGGRTIESPIFPFKELGDWEGRVTPSPYFSGHITMSETPLGRSTPQPPSPEELERRAAANERGCGQALTGRLLKALLDRGVEPRTSCRARELIVEDGQVVGVRVEGPEGEIEGRARAGVVLAVGGFEWDPDLVRAFLRGPMTHPVSMPTCEGDGLRMAMKAGAKLGNMREAWWIPAAVVPREDNWLGLQLMSGPRCLPRSIMVNKEGRRFTNESANYNAFGAAFHVLDVSRFEWANLPCWMILDQGYVDRFGFGGRFGKPGTAAEWATSAPTLGELASKLGIPAGNLEETVTRWNANVAAGHDPDFHRGESAHDRWWGDPNNKQSIEASLGPIERGPFYATEIKSGTLGTKGGPVTDEDARVLDIDGRVIPGLYAAGNTMASAFGMTYGGPGGTLGPAMTFGWLAGRHAAGRAAALEPAASAARGSY